MGMHFANTRRMHKIPFKLIIANPFGLKYYSLQITMLFLNLINKKLRVEPNNIVRVQKHTHKNNIEK